MASGNRASMREGPLAQLFRKTEDDAPQGAENRKPAQEPKAGRPLPKDGPAPQTTRHVPEPQAHKEQHRSGPGQARPRARRAGAQGRSAAASHRPHDRGRPPRRGARGAAARARAALEPLRGRAQPRGSAALRLLVGHPREHPRPRTRAPRSGRPIPGADDQLDVRRRDRAEAARGGRRRRRRQRRQPHDRGPGRGRRLHRGQHRHAIARGLRGRTRVHIGSDLTRGLGSGSNPELGQAAASRATTS